jgi:hypothetical protein
MDIKETEWEVVNWICVFYDRDKWWDVVDLAVKCRIL